MSAGRARRRSPVVMIGLDAADLDFILAHLPSLPNLARALDAGTLGRLQSTAGLLPGSVWPTFYTAARPGNHGIYHHLQWDAASMRLRRVREDWLYAEPFWYSLERAGLEVAALDVPMTFPPALKRGVEIINWGSHDQLYGLMTHPPHLAREVKRRFGSHPMGAEIPVDKTPRQLELIRRNLVAGTKRKSELAKWLLAQRDWDFFLTVFGETHRGGHILWPDSTEANEHDAFAAIIDVYHAVDAAIGDIMTAVPDGATVILFALHGMGANVSQEHLIPKIMDRINAGFAGGVPAGAVAAAKTAEPARQRSLMRLLRERIPDRVQHAVAQAVPVAVRDAVVNRQVTAGYDWNGTPGLALLADLNGYLRFNLRGRERDGLLQPDSRDLAGYRDWIHRCLTALRVHETGAPLVEEVLFDHEEFRGERGDFLPDVVVTWNAMEPVSQVYSEELGSIHVERSTGRGGNHRAEGFFVVVGGSAATQGPPPTHIRDLGGLVSRLLG